MTHHSSIACWHRCTCLLRSVTLLSVLDLHPVHPNETHKMCCTCVAANGCCIKCAQKKFPSLRAEKLTVAGVQASRQFSSIRLAGSAFCWRDMYTVLASAQWHCLLGPVRKLDWVTSTIQETDISRLLAISSTATTVRSNFCALFRLMYKRQGFVCLPALSDAPALTELASQDPS